MNTLDPPLNSRPPWLVKPSTSTSNPPFKPPIPSKPGSTSSSSSQALPSNLPTLAQAEERPAKRFKPDPQNLVNDRDPSNMNQTHRGYRDPFKSSFQAVEAVVRPRRKTRTNDASATSRATLEQSPRSAKCAAKAVDSPIELPSSKIEALEPPLRTLSQPKHDRRSNGRASKDQRTYLSDSASASNEGDTDTHLRDDASPPATRKEIRRTKTQHERTPYSFDKVTQDKSDELGENMQNYPSLFTPVLHTNSSRLQRRDVVPKSIGPPRDGSEMRTPGGSPDHSLNSKFKRDQKADVEDDLNDSPDPLSTDSADWLPRKHDLSGGQSIRPSTTGKSLKWYSQNLSRQPQGALNSAQDYHMSKATPPKDLVGKKIRNSWLLRTFLHFPHYYEGEGKLVFVQTMKKFEYNCDKFTAEFEPDNITNATWGETAHALLTGPGEGRQQIRIHLIFQDKPEYLRFQSLFRRSFKSIGYMTDTE